MRRLPWILATLALTGALPAAASGATLCVNRSGPQCDQVFAADGLDSAVATALANGGGTLDRIEIGPGLYAEGAGYSAQSLVQIVGAGRDLTVISNTAPATTVLSANVAGTLVSDLTVRIGPGASASGLVMGAGTVERVRIETAPGATPALGLNQVGGTVRQLEVAMSTGTAVSLSSADLDDADLIAPAGGLFQGATARRVRLTAVTSGLQIGSGPTRVEDAVVRLGGAGPAIATRPFSGTDLTLSHVTLIGAGGVGVLAAGGTGASAAQLQRVAVRNAVIQGFTRAVRRQGFAGGQSGCGSSCQVAVDLTVDHSALDLPQGIEDLGGPGTLAVGGGNIDVTDPQKVSVATGDLRPRFDSPLVDVGDPAPLGAGPSYLNESPLDAAGALRVVDGRPGGATVARRDIGAFEYQRLAPTVGVAFSGAARADKGTVRVRLYRPLRILARGADPDADALRFTIDIDGTRHPRSIYTRRFAGLGRHTIAVTATDPTGLAATTTRAVTVFARPGRCANARAGTGRADLFRGTKAGDDLRGGAGADRLSGGPGADCLTGGPGRDLLRGGPGADVLIGGAGRDVLAGGTGSDRILARDGRRDTVVCGPGRDRATVDALDRTTGCEVVRRPSP